MTCKELSELIETIQQKAHCGVEVKLNDANE